MASIQAQQTKTGTYFYLQEKVDSKVVKTYLGTKPPIAKSRGWTGLSPEIVEWLKERTKQKTKPIKLEPSQKGRYRTIVIDPPWPMERVEMIARTSEKPFDYPTMTITQIKNDRKRVPVRKLADRTGSFIFLWTTQKFLQSAFDILTAWGFRHLFTMVWHKSGGRQLVGLPAFNCEFILVGRRGNINFTTTKGFTTCFDGTRRDHSRKPDEFYNHLRKICPEPRIDIFSREKRRGFDQFGNETEKFS